MELVKSVLHPKKIRFTTSELVGLNSLQMFTSKLEDINLIEMLKDNLEFKNKSIGHPVKIEFILVVMVCKIILLTIASK